MRGSIQTPDLKGSGASARLHETSSGARPIVRRPRVERTALLCLRSARIGGRRHQDLVDLRTVASGHGLHMLAADAAYLADSELTLLAWIAVAQRQAYAIYLPADRALSDAIAQGAAALQARGLLLSPFSIYTPWLRKLAGVG